MNKLKQIERLVKLTRPQARFVKAAYMDKVKGDDVTIDDYYLVCLYDAKIDSVFNKCSLGFYIINNTYLSSFAYNLYLGVMLYHGKNPATERKLLCHNLKKFYAEQMFSKYNCIFSRAILIETLLEEENMRTVFTKIKDNNGLSQRAKIVASIMNSLISFHELGHHIFHDANGWDLYVAKLSRNEQSFICNMGAKYPHLFFEEIKCDILAVNGCIENMQSTEGLKDILNIIIFGYAAFSAMFSLVKSAKITVNEIQRNHIEKVDFNSIKTISRDYAYTIGIDLDFKERTSIMIQYCQIIAENHNIVLNDNINDKLHPNQIMNYLLSALDEIMVSENLFIRNIAMLFSESLCGHPKGAEFLYLRSKVFTSNRKLE